MAFEKVEAGNRVGRGPGLGVGASWAAASNPEHIIQPLALQARKLCDRFGFSPERALITAELAFDVRGRR